MKKPKLGYICKYTPVELLEALGFEMIRLEETVSSFPTADALLHPNLCSYAKAVLETASDAFSGRDPLQGIVLTTCCDSIRRLYDRLRVTYPDRFFYLLDIPRKANEFAAGLYADQIHRLRETLLRDFSGILPDQDMPADPPVFPKKTVPQETDPCEPSLQIGLMGARIPHPIRQLLEERHVNVLFDLTCNGMMRQMRPPQIMEGASSSGLRDYAFALLNQIPCMRMTRASDRSSLLDAFLDRLDGILYHTVKFCDNFSFEYADFRKTLDVPLLQLETDYTGLSAGQVTTRLDAFLEELSQRKHHTHAPVFVPHPAKGDHPMFVLGIDSGSTSTNSVLLNEKKEIVAFDVIRTGAKSTDSAQRILDATCQKANLSRQDISCIVSTGYGRVSIPFADKNVTEISCHGKGAHFLNPSVRTILDIGGQDSKAIRLNDAGEVVDFVMNDKCAAGTGRFLEAMARTLEIEIDTLGPLSLQSRGTVEISSMCTVFAESEVISLIAQNKETADIARGVHIAIAKKSIGMLRKVGLEEAVMMTGGVAKNAGVVAVLEELLHTKLILPKEPEIVGALGAALYALDS